MILIGIPGTFGLQAGEDVRIALLLALGFGMVLYGCAEWMLEIVSDVYRRRKCNLRQDLRTGRFI